MLASPFVEENYFYPYILNFTHEKGFLSLLYVPQKTFFRAPFYLFLLLSPLKYK